MQRQIPETRDSSRRRPRQSRARQTSLALQEAFVRLLTEREYDAITIREIVGLAGTGLGSFYEYFASKEDLARVCLHLRSKRVLTTLHALRMPLAGLPLDAVVPAVVAGLLDAHRDQPAQWAAHYFLERRLSDARAYASMYDRFVREWAQLLDAAADLRGGASMEVARTCQTIAYGMIAHAHVRQFAGAGAGDAIDYAALTQHLQRALLAYLNAAAAPAPPVVTAAPVADVV
jgi:AcrR family transcriptional regulator